MDFFFDKRILAIECKNKSHIKLIKKIIKKKVGKILIFSNRAEYLNKFLDYKKQADIYFVKKSEILSCNPLISTFNDLIILVLALSLSLSIDNIRCSGLTFKSSKD